MPEEISNNAFDSSNIKEAEPEDYSKVINQLLASSLAGRFQLWPRAELFQAHKPSYFKPDTNLYRDTLRKDRRNGKELEYIHSAGTWIEQALCSLEPFKESTDAGEQGRLLSILEDSLLASKEILAMRTSHFYAFLSKGPAVARQLAEMVETKVEVVIDIVSFHYYVKPAKLQTLRYIAASLLQHASKPRRWFRERLVRTFTGKSVSQLLPLPFARLFTRGLYDDIRSERRRLGSYHDAADVGYGATLGRDMTPGAAGEVQVHSAWSPFLRLRSITYRELVAVRKALEHDLIQAKLVGHSGTIRLHVDNMAVFYIVNNMVSSKPDLMCELRRLHERLTDMKIILQATWIPTGLNEHADRLSRTGTPPTSPRPLL